MPSRTPKPATPGPRTASDNDPYPASQKSSETARPLNVTDALSYLDAVKVQFQDKPDVYNHFLDIMKDFKSEAIDTPGVIERVSMLFHGNPDLIQGFNTFLPPGYRIDISVDPRDPNIIKVTTPSGTTTQTTNTLHSFPRPIREGGAKSALAVPLVTSRSITPYQMSHTQHSFDSFSPGLQGSSTTAAATFLGGLGGRNGVENKPAGEFNHAIQYLNKIKARYADDPDTYKQFLEILQTYQKEQRQIQDSQVYAQVQVLFKDAPDLLAEFKDFLPEVSMAFSGTNGASIEKDKNGKKAVVSAAKKRRKAPEKDTTPVPPSRSTVSRAKKAKHVHKPGEQDSPHYAPHGLPPASPPHAGLPAPLSQSHVMPPPPLPHMGIMHGAPSIINPPHPPFFLGDGDLLTQFKDVLRVDERQTGVEHGPPGSTRTGPPEPLPALPADEGEGPSYRKLPESEVHLACSGRDELCRSVLNDIWVSHPTWASEEAGFIAHKKNSFEEALHKSEEERHEYHVQLEALARTIALFEPLNARIEEMTNEERAAFRLKADFGGPSKNIYHRTLKRVYGREPGVEVIQALQECPSVAVPVVLARLKAKDEEWRRIQREWNKTWREVDAKNFYKSLDHQGNQFKQNDKKQITSKNFVQNMEGIKEAQEQTRAIQQGLPSFAAGSLGHQLEFEFQQTSVLQDSLRLVYSFLDRSQAQYSPQERRAIEGWLREFVPLLYMFPAAEFDAACGPSDGLHDEVLDHEVLSGPRSGSRSAGGGQGLPIAAGDLRRQLLKTAQEKSLRIEGGDSHVLTQLSSTSPRSPHDAADSRRGCNWEAQTENNSDDMWIHTNQTSTSSGVDLPRRKPFFANTTLYTLLSLLQLIYSRLIMCKEDGAKHVSENLNPMQCNPIAIELGLDDPNGPGAVLRQAMEALGEQQPSSTPNLVYMYFLGACEKLFDNELEVGLFEEHMRWFFGNEAYLLFTLDKLIAAFIKQVHSVLSDNKSQELWTLLQDTRTVETLSTQAMIRYRREAERHVGSDGYLYRIEWEAHSKKMYIQLLEVNDPSAEVDRSAIGRWQEYIASYVLRQPTEWLPEQKEEGKRTLFLRRNISTDESPLGVVARCDGMRIRISQGTYRMLYEAGTEDVLVQRRSAEEEKELREKVRGWTAERNRFRWLQG
ncbi:hypothetical protein BU15DRAFT_85551 [Melanogaster broomeanus]|nr:hypothetical protein BU15DRAFT_85551 [Melanogaster broomeanus]